MKTNQKGFMLVTVIFLAVAITAMAAGTFLTVSRHYRVVQKDIDRVKIQWAASALMDRAAKLFTDYMIVKGTYPEASGSEITGVEAVHPDPASPGTAILFKDYLGSWYDSFRSKHASGGSPSNTNVDELLQNILISDLSVRRSDTGLGTISRTYRVQCRFRYQFPAETMAESFFSQEFTVQSAPLYDFFSFYDEDIEISSGSNAIVQGPIFSNSDMYIMPGEGKRITFTLPSDERSSNRFILSTAGDIYYYFKKTAAKNYFLDPADSSYNPVYARGAPAYYNTGEGDPDEPGGDIFSKGYSLGTACNDHRNVPPDPYYKYAGYIPCDQRKWGGVLGVDKDNAKLQKPWPTDPGMKFTEVWTGYNNYIGDSQWEFYRFPWWYYLRNQLRHIPDAANPENQNRIFFCSTATCDTSPSCVGEYCPVELTPYREFPSQGKGNAYPGSYFYVPFPYSGWNQMDYGGRNVLPSSVVTPTNPLPRMAENWTPEDPQMATGLVPNPNFQSQIDQKRLTGLVMTHQSPRVLNLGTLAGNNHVLIEPIQGSDTPEVQKAKLQNQAEIHILCLDETCTGILARSVGVDAGGDIFYRTLLDSEWGSWASVSNLYDYRLGESFRTVNIDIGALKNRLASLAPDKFDRGYALYVQACQENCASNSIRLVRLQNGGTLPMDGLTIITNGRLWIQGDYNTTEYDYDPTAAEKMQFPSSAVFSDSFGILSNQWSDGYNSDTSLICDAGHPSCRSVTSSVTVHTAVIAGFLPSQLQKLFPDCKSASMATLHSGCLDHWVGDQIAWVEKVGDSYRPIGAYCETGLNAEGQPLDPRTCSIWVDKETSIYYYRRVFLINYLYIQAYLRSRYPECVDKLGRPNFSVPGGTDGTDYVSSCPAGTRSAFFNWPQYDHSKYAEASDPVNPGDLYFNANNPFKQAQDALVNLPVVADPTDPDCTNPSSVACSKVDWVHWTGDDVLRNCAQNTSCWTNFKNALKTVAVATPSGTATAEIGVLDPWPWWWTFPDSDKAQAYRKLFYPDVPCTLAEDNLCRMFFDAAHPRSPTVPRWEIPFTAAGSYRGPGMNYDTGIRLQDNNPPEGVPPFPGVNFALLNAFHNNSYLSVFSHPLYREYASKLCNAYQMVCVRTEPTCTENCFCANQYTCVSGVYVFPGITYVHGRYIPLYEIRYSGGLENLINFQEDWKETVPLNFSGVLIAPWHAVGLKKANGTPAYWNATLYYTAPARNYDYDEDLRTNPPPGSPDVYAVKRSRYRESLSGTN